MKFTALTIPEGVVTKITCGGVVLWQKLVCDPWIQIDVVAPQPESGIYENSAICRIGGISKELVRTFELVSSIGGTHAISLTDADTETGYETTIVETNENAATFTLRLEYDCLCEEDHYYHIMETVPIDTGRSTAWHGFSSVVVTEAVCGSGVCGVTICGDYEEVTA